MMDEVKGTVDAQVKETAKNLEFRVYQLTKQVNSDIHDLNRKLELSGGGGSKGLEQVAEDIKNECAQYFARMNRTDIKIQEALMTIKGLNEHFDQKQEKLRTDLI